MTSNILEGIKAVIFDLGDTLYTLPYSIADYHMKFLKEVCGDDFIVSYDELDEAHNIADCALGDLIDEIASDPKYALSTEEWVYFDRVLLENLGVHEDIDEKSKRYQSLWNELLTNQPNILRHGAKDVLEELASRGYKMGVATNWMEDPHELLSSSGIRHLFQSLQWTIVRGYAKPSPYLLIMNAHELGVNPLRCAFVGNKLKLDMEAARRACMKPVLLSQSATESLGHGEDILVIEDLKELLEYL
jgi:FMN phosphatase YigB (HAD superfamily)